MTANAMPAPLPGPARRKKRHTPDPVHLTLWMATLVRVEAFVAETGDLPRISRTTPPPEQLLYRWVLAQRQRGLSPAYRAILDDRIPGWDNPVRLRETVFIRRVQDLKVYRDAYGTWPTSRSRDEFVASLAFWFGNIRVAGREDTLPARHRQLLDTQVPGWNDSVEQTWERTAHEIAEFSSRTGHMPSSISPEHSERRLARWMSDKRRGRNMTPARAALLDEVLPGWRFGMKGGRRARQAA